MKIGALSCSILAIIAIASAATLVSTERHLNRNYDNSDGDATDVYYRKFKLKLPKVARKYHTVWKEPRKTTDDKNAKKINETKVEQSVEEAVRSKFLQSLRELEEERSNEPNSLTDRSKNRPKREILLNSRSKDAYPTSYYEQRKAVMDKFYARQREISKKYTERQRNSLFLTSSTPPASTVPPYAQNRTNSTLDGSTPPKLRTQLYDDKRTIRDIQTVNGGKTVWGQCRGNIVYQQNLVLHATGSSDLNTVFRLSTQGKHCITCVVTQKQNDIESSVTLKSGGPSNTQVVLNIMSNADLDISYNIKIWAVPKTPDNCIDVII